MGKKHRSCSPALSGSHSSATRLWKNVILLAAECNWGSFNIVTEFPTEWKPWLFWARSAWQWRGYTAYDGYDVDVEDVKDVEDVEVVVVAAVVISEWFQIIWSNQIKLSDNLTSYKISHIWHFALGKFLPEFINEGSCRKFIYLTSFKISPNLGKSKGILTWRCWCLARCSFRSVLHQMIWGRFSMNNWTI